MPYLSCTSCRVRIYRGGAVTAWPCPSCGSDLVVHDVGRPDPLLSFFLERRLPRASASATRLLALERRVAARIARGGSLADVEREIIFPSALEEAQRPALRRYARALLNGARQGDSRALPPEAQLGG